MVLRYLIPFFLIFSAHAQKVTKQDLKTFKEAKGLYTRGNFEGSLRILQSRFNLRSVKTPSGALKLAAYNYQRLGKYRTAKSIYAYLIKKKFKNLHVNILRSYLKNNSVDDVDDEIPDELAELYHRRSEVMSKLYMEKYDELSITEKESYPRLIRMYVELIGESDYEDDTYEEISTELDAFEKDINERMYKTSYFASVEYISWRDVLVLNTPNNGGDLEINSTAEGWCMGGGMRYENATWLFGGTGCVARANATVGNDGSSGLGYFQKDVPLTALIFGGQALYKPTSKDAAFGINIPLIYRTGDYTEPPGGYTLDNKSVISVGYLLEGQWTYESFIFSSKIGKLLGFSSSIWSLGISYKF